RPPNGPATSIGRYCMARARPTSRAEWVSWSTSQGWAMLCIQVPTVETSWPPRNRREFRWRRAPSPRRRGDEAAGLGAVATVTDVLPKWRIGPPERSGEPWAAGRGAASPDDD